MTYHKPLLWTVELIAAAYSYSPAMQNKEAANLAITAMATKKCFRKFFAQKSTKTIKMCKIGKKQIAKTTAKMTQYRLPNCEKHKIVKTTKKADIIAVTSFFSAYKKLQVRLFTFVLVLKKILHNLRNEKG